MAELTDLVTQIIYDNISMATELELPPEEFAIEIIARLTAAGYLRVPKEPQ